MLKNCKHCNGQFRGKPVRQYCSRQCYKRDCADHVSAVKTAAKRGEKWLGLRTFLASEPLMPSNLKRLQTGQMKRGDIVLLQMAWMKRRDEFLRELTAIPAAYNNRLKYVVTQRVIGGGQTPYHKEGTHTHRVGENRRRERLEVQGEGEDRIGVSMSKFNFAIDSWEKRGKDKCVCGHIRSRHLIEGCVRANCLCKLFRLRF